MVEALEKDGWNLKSRESRTDPDALTHYLKVEVSYRARPPKIVCIPNLTRRKVFITEQTVDSLDYVEILNVDLTINPYVWEVNGELRREGISRYHVCHYRRGPARRQVRGRRGGCLMRRYGFFNFLFDVFMVSVTGGFWLIWIFIREMRRG